MQTQVVTLRWYNCIHNNIDIQKQKQTIAFKLYCLDIKVNLKVRSLLCPPQYSNNNHAAYIYAKKCS